jgi:hypothetical protein
MQMSSSSSKRVHPRKASRGTRATLSARVLARGTSIAEGRMRHPCPPAFVTSACAGINGGDARRALASNPFVPFP